VHTVEIELEQSRCKTKYTDFRSN